MSLSVQVSRFFLLFFGAVGGVAGEAVLDLAGAAVPLVLRPLLLLRLLLHLLLVVKNRTSHHPQQKANPDQYEENGACGGLGSLVVEGFAVREEEVVRVDDHVGVVPHQPLKELSQQAIRNLHKEWLDLVEIRDCADVGDAEAKGDLLGEDGGDVG